MKVEPLLPPLTGETLRFATNREDEACVDAGFWDVSNRRLSLFLKCSMLILLHTVVPGIIAL